MFVDFADIKKLLFDEDSDDDTESECPDFYGDGYLSGERGWRAGVALKNWARVVVDDSMSVVELDLGEQEMSGIVL